MNIRAKKAVIVATGGMTSHLNFRRMFDPRLTDVLTVAGEPYSYQDASGELAAMAIGASLWGLVNQTLENGDNIRTQRVLATKWNYMTWELKARFFRWSFHRLERKGLARSHPGQPSRQAILRRDQRRLPARQRLQRHQPVHAQ